MRKGFFLILILILAATLRVYNAGEKGIIASPDEATHLLEARWCVSGIKAIISAISQGLPLKDALSKIREEAKGKAPTLARPLHTLILAIFSFPFGEVNEFATVLPSTTFGLLTILLLYFFTKSILDEKTALLASLFLTLLPPHIYYCRIAFPEVTYTFFLLLAFFFYQKNFFFSSLFLAFSALCHYRMLLFAPLFFLIFEALRLWENRQFLNFIRRMGLFLLIFSATIFLFQLPYVFAELAFKKAGTSLPFPSYFGQLFHIFMVYQKKVKAPFEIFSVLAHPYMLLRVCGPLFLFFAIIGFFLRTKFYIEKAFYVVPFLAPLLYFSIHVEHHLRFLAMSFPFLCVASAHGVSTIFKSRKNVVICVTLLLVFWLPLIWEVVSINSGYKEVYNFLGNKKHLSTYPQLSVFYTDWQYVENVPENKEELEALYERGYIYLVADMHKHVCFGWAWRDDLKKRFKNITFLLEDVQRQCTPVFEVEDRRGVSPYYWFEHCASFKRMLNIRRETPTAFKEKIMVFALKDYLRK